MMAKTWLQLRDAMAFEGSSFERERRMMTGSSVFLLFSEMERSSSDLAGQR